MTGFDAIPLHLAIALAEIGVSEVAGPAANPRIAEYEKVAGLAPDDETSWCAAFACWCLEQAGIPSPRKPNARSFVDDTWGAPSDSRFGAICVLWRESPDSWKGHVGFVLWQTPSSVILLSGNTGNAVSVAKFSLSRVLGYRVPA